MGERYTVEEFTDKLQELADWCQTEGKDAPTMVEMREGILELKNARIVDDPDYCECRVDVNLGAKQIEIDECDKHYERTGDELEKQPLEEVVEKLREGKHLISCVPGDGYCRCAVEMVEGVLA